MSRSGGAAVPGPPGTPLVLVVGSRLRLWLTGLSPRRNRNYIPMMIVIMMILAESWDKAASCSKSKNGSLST